jgi:multiple sugar transport system permease protein
MFTSDRYAKYGFFFVLPSVVFFGFVFFYPLALAFWNAFHSVNILQGTSEWAGIGKFVKVVSHSGFQNSVTVTFLYVLMVVPALLVFSLTLSAIVVSLRQKLYADVAATIFFLPVITSLVSAGIIWQWIFDPTLGVVNNVLSALGVRQSFGWLQSPTMALPTVAVIGFWARLGFDLVIFVTAINSIPDSYYEAADIDGASEIQQFFRITLPLLNPQIFMVSTIEFIFAFKAFDQIFVTTRGGPSGATKTVMVFLLKDVFNNDYGAACAITVLLLCFLFTISFVQWRFFSGHAEQ